MKDLISRARRALPEKYKQPRRAKHFTTNYKHWSGASVSGELKSELHMRMLPEGGTQIAMRWKMSDDRIYMGFAPMPQNNWEWFWYDWHHGRIMQFDRLSVLVFALGGIGARKHIKARVDKS